jgi:hypothetical protein
MAVSDREGLESEFRNFVFSNQLDHLMQSVILLQEAQDTALPDDDEDL